MRLMTFNFFIMSITRRKFVETSLKSAAAAGMVSMLPAGIAGCKTTKDRLVVGLIGAKGMGWSNASEFIKHPDIELAAICDVDQNVLDQRIADATEILQKKTDQGIPVSIKKPKGFSDYRKLLEEKDIDAVIIGTPDHWHCLTAVDAMDAGKDIYLEKPMANSIGECLIIEKAANKYKKVVQIGQWQRSNPHWIAAMDFVHSGALGPIRLVKCWAYMNWFKVKPYENSPVPPGVDYDFWLGPAPKRPFNRGRFHFDWRWHWDYGGGLMTDWGVHMIDFALYGMQQGVPKSAMSSGGIFAHPEGAMETPDTQQTVFEFDGFNLLWECAIGIAKGPYNRSHGVAFIGDNGTLVVDRGGWEVHPEYDSSKKADKMEAVARIKGENTGNPLHVRNFIDCAKSGNRETLASARIGREVGVVAHMGNAALLSGEKIYWSQEEEQFTSAAVNEMIYPEYRGPWVLPKI